MKLQTGLAAMGLLLVVGSSLPAQLPPIPEGAQPRQFWTGAGGAYFCASGSQELWRYDAREDFFEAMAAGSDCLFLGASSDAGYFALGEESDNTSLFLAGTSGASEVPSFLRLAVFRWLGRVYSEEHRPRPHINRVPVTFEADTGSGRGLWMNGVEIARPIPLEDGSLLADLTRFRDRTYFIARDRHRGRVLWGSDPSGAFRPLFSPDPKGRSPFRLIGEVGARMILVMPGPGPELWVTDGSQRRTRPLIEIIPGPDSAAIVDWSVVGGRVFFIVDEGHRGRELWTSDGTAPGTRRLTRFQAVDPFVASSLPRLGITDVFGGDFSAFIFFADDGVHGLEPWRTDGTARGTRLIADLCPGPCSSRGVAGSTLFGEHLEGLRVLFAATIPGVGREPWVTDGTSEGTSLLADVCPGPCSSLPRNMATGFFGSLFTTFFLAGTGPGERALWRTDGIPGDVARLTPPGVQVMAPPDVGGSGFFAARDALGRDDLWITRGSPETTLSLPLSEVCCH